MKKKCRTIITLEVLTSTDDEIETKIRTLADTAPDIALYCIWILREQLCAYQPQFEADFLVSLVKNQNAVHYFTKLLRYEIENQTGIFEDSLPDMVMAIIENGCVKDGIEALRIVREMCEQSVLYDLFCKISNDSTNLNDFLLIIKSIPLFFDEADQQFELYESALGTSADDALPFVFDCLVSNKSMLHEQISEVFHKLPLSAPIVNIYASYLINQSIMDMEELAFVWHWYNDLFSGVELTEIAGDLQMRESLDLAAKLAQLDGEVMSPEEIAYITDLVRRFDTGGVAESS